MCVCACVRAHVFHVSDSTIIFHFKILCIWMHTHAHTHDHVVLIVNLVLRRRQNVVAIGDGERRLKPIKSSRYSPTAPALTRIKILQLYHHSLSISSYQPTKYLGEPKAPRFDICAVREKQHLCAG